MKKKETNELKIKKNKVKKRWINKMKKTEIWKKTENNVSFLISKSDEMKTVNEKFVTGFWK